MRKLKLSDLPLLVPCVLFLLLNVSSAFFDFGTLEGVSKAVFLVVFSTCLLSFILTTFYCVGQAIDKKRGISRIVWILLILFVSFIGTPVFYWMYVSPLKKN